MDPCYSQLSEFFYCLACKGDSDLASLNKIMTGWTDPFDSCQQKTKKADAEAGMLLLRWRNAPASLAFSLPSLGVCLRYRSCVMPSVVTMWLIALLGFPGGVQWDRCSISCH